MGRHSCCYKQKLRKGLWSPEEDEKLLNYITKHGHGCWSSVPKLAGRMMSTILYNTSCFHHHFINILLLQHVHNTTQKSFYLINLPSLKLCVSGLQRCGKSCRLRWINYLRPDLKRGAFSQQEENSIVELHAVLGNKY